MSSAERVGHGVNTTGYKALDALGRDPRVERIDNEGRVSAGGDGLWLYTAAGWCNGDVGSHIIHEDTVAAVRSAAKYIRACDCADCAAQIETRQRANLHASLGISRGGAR